MSICRHKNHIPDKFRTNNVLCLDCNVSIHKDAVKPSYDELQAEVERLQSELSESVKNGENLHLEVERLATYAKAIDEREPDSSGYALREIGMCYEEFDMLLRKAQKEGSE